MYISAGGPVTVKPHELKTGLKVWFLLREQLGSTDKPSTLLFISQVKNSEN